MHGKLIGQAVAAVAGELELRVGAIIEAFATTRPVVEVRGPSLVLLLLLLLTMCSQCTDSTAYFN